MEQQSSTETTPQMLALKDACEVLVKHFGHNEGLWDISFEFQIAIGAFGPSQEQVLPGAMFGISKVGIAKVTKPGPNTVDASLINPASNGDVATI